MMFIDFTEAFDTDSRDGLWKIMAMFACPPRFIAMVRQFHDGTRACVTMMESSLNPLVEQGKLFRTVILVFLSGTVLMANYSI